MYSLYFSSDGLILRKKICYTHVERGRVLSGNAIRGDLLLYDLVLFYALSRDCDIERIFFIRKFFASSFVFIL